MLYIEKRIESSSLSRLAPFLFLLLVLRRTQLPLTAAATFLSLAKAFTRVALVFVSGKHSFVYFTKEKKKIVFKKKTQEDFFEL